MKRWLLVGVLGLVAVLLILATLFAGLARAPRDPDDALATGGDAWEQNEVDPRALPRVVSGEGQAGEDSDSNAPWPPEPAPSKDKAPASSLRQQAVRDLFDDDTQKAPDPEPLEDARRDEAPPPRAAKADQTAALAWQADEEQPEPHLPAIAPYDPTAGEPSETLPAVAYFENTYLGGSARHVEQLRRLDALTATHPWRAVTLPPQPFDRPDDAGLSLSAAIDRPYLAEPARVMLQVGLEGSARAGWRRPPLDVVVVIDDTALAEPVRVVRALGALLARLDGADRIAVRRAGDAAPLVALSTADAARRALLHDPDALIGPRDDAPLGALTEALTAAGGDLDASAQSARIPGTGVVLLLVGRAAHAAPSAEQAAHRLTTEGVTVSVVEFAPPRAAPRSRWWAVAHSGHGGHHRARALDDIDAAVDAELDRLSRVVARLVRLNIRLAPGVRAIRVLGSRLLRDDEVRQVKAREEAVDARLSRTLGVSADRGDDDDGLQTVIPYFLGQDSHVVLIELWVERAGPIADVSVRYKDMVRLDNGRAAAHVSVGALPRPASPVNTQVLRNARGFAFAEAVAQVSIALRYGGDPVERALEAAYRQAVDAGDRRLLDRLRTSGLGENGLSEAFAVTAQRRLGVGHALADTAAD